MINYAIDKLKELLLKAEMEDRIRHKKRYVSKVSAYRDLIILLKNIKDSE